jgi:nucleoside-diphosphate-sugar epimerase
VTGANGFIGSALLFRLSRDAQHHVKAALRAKISNIPDGATPVQIGALCPETDWQPAVSDVNTIVHTAARVHVMSDTADDPLAEFRRVNVEGTLNLARQAAAAGVGRFIFISSIKVNGEGTPLGQPYTADDAPAPVDPYGVSKREAEDGLRQLAAETGMEVVIIRPPLVYGPGVKANFLSMMRWLRKRLPLPFGAIHNQRSLVALDNLVDLIITCIDHPAAANQTLLVSDGEDISTTELIRRMAHALDLPVRLIPLPTAAIMVGATLLGKREEAARLCSSLQVDSIKVRELLSWSPPITMDEGLRRTASHYLQQL